MTVIKGESNDYYFLKFTVSLILTYVTQLLMFFSPVIVYLIIAGVLLIMDCVSAYRLSRRVKRKTKASTGKFRSDKGKKAFVTLAQVFYLVMMAYLIDYFIIRNPTDIWTVRSVMLAFSFVEIWSILENESSLNGSKWAKLLQKVMVSKVERHYDVDLPEFK